MRWIVFWTAAVAWGQTAGSIAAQKQSVAAQRAAVQRQTAAAATVTAPCEPLDPEVVAPLIDKAAHAQQLPAKLVRAVVAQESGFRPCAESKKGAQGLMQLMPATADDLDVAEPFDPTENVAAGTKYLRQLLEKYKGDLRLALAAYNSGPAAVDGAGGVPDIAETRAYVEAIVGAVGLKQIDLPSIPMPKPIGN